MTEVAADYTDQAVTFDNLCHPRSSAAIFGLIIAVGISVCDQPLRAADRDALALAAASITTEELKEVVGVLADDTFEGREAGSRGGHAAANYVVKAFERLAALPAGDSGTYFQAFNGSCRNILGLVEGSDPQLK